MSWAQGPAHFPRRSAALSTCSRSAVTSAEGALPALSLCLPEGSESERGGEFQTEKARPCPRVSVSLVRAKGKDPLVQGTLCWGLGPESGLRRPLHHQQG